VHPRDERIALRYEISVFGKRKWKTILTYFDKSLKCQVIPHFFINPVRRNRIVGDILHIRLSPVQRSVIHGSRDALDIRMLFSLDFMKFIYKAFMVVVQFRVVVENLCYEFLQTITRQNGRLSCSERIDVDLVRTRCKL